MILNNRSFTNFRGFKINLLIIFILMFTLLPESTIKAQANSNTEYKNSSVNNIFKLNIAGLLVGSISIQDEVYFKGKVSAALGFNYSVPGLFWPKYLLTDTNIDFASMKISGYSITPELRFYLSGIAPKGFYIAPYYRYSNYSLENLNIHYTNDAGVTNTVLEGKYIQNAVGIMIGKQKRSGQHWVTDWWIMGLAYGTGLSEVSVPGQYKDEEVTAFKNAMNESTYAIDPSGSGPAVLKASYSKSISGRMGFSIGYIF